MTIAHSSLFIEHLNCVEDTVATTNDYEPIEIHGYFRSHTHLPIWEVLDKAGIWRRVGITVDFTYCDSSSEAEAALFEGRVDLVSGNHISPYALVARRKPIVSLASATNGVSDRLISRESDQFARANTRQARHRHDRAGQWWRL
jgi:hypothetical protein